DGIRAELVTGVQTCALPISRRSRSLELRAGPETRRTGPARTGRTAAYVCLRVALREMVKRARQRYHSPQPLSNPCVATRQPCSAQPSVTRLTPRPRRLAAST